MAGPYAPYYGLPKRLWEALEGSKIKLPSKKRPGNRPIERLVLEGVSFRYPGTKAGVKGIDLDLSGERSVALMGPNGSGKSTLGKLISGLQPPDKGSVEGNGSAFYLFQRPASMFFSETVADELHGLRPPGGCCELLGLLPLMEMDPALLSEGEKQRLGAAIALSSGKDLLVLDEPFKALDGPVAELVFCMLSAKDAPSHIIITNDPENASRCSRVVIMKDGTIRSTGAPEQVLSDPRLMAEFGWPVTPASVVARRAGIGRAAGFHEMLSRLEAAR